MSYSKAKGTAFETAVVNYFRDCGFRTARRVPLSGAAGDKGDIWVGDDPIVPNLVIECKNYAKTLPYKMIHDFMEEAIREYVNATDNVVLNAGDGILIVKIPNLGVADSWFIYVSRYGIITRCRLGDIINKELYHRFDNDDDKIKELKSYLN